MNIDGIKQIDTADETVYMLGYELFRDPIGENEARMLKHLNGVQRVNNLASQNCKSDILAFLKPSKIHRFVLTQHKDVALKSVGTLFSLARMIAVRDKSLDKQVAKIVNKENKNAHSILYDLEFLPANGSTLTVGYVLHRLPESFCESQILLDFQKQKLNKLNKFTDRDRDTEFSENEIIYLQKKFPDYEIEFSNNTRATIIPGDKFVTLISMRFTKR